MANFDKQKAFGQHFLIDQNTIKAIVDATIGATHRCAEHSVLEIGPGQGAITRPLLQALPIETSFNLAERDRELISLWEGESRVKTLLKGDFLNVSEAELDSLGKIIIVSNLPYSAGTAIVVRLAERSKQIPEMILMFQAEVAKRLYAKASTADRGSLSLYIQNEWEVEKILTVGPQAFRPPPKVMSEVLHLKRRPKPLISFEKEGDRAAFSDLLKQAFKHRRKMVKGNFAGTRWQEAFLKSGVLPTHRAESLEWEDWIKIWNCA
jgi:16S rRNA (adenine1518-N6/adenine1519-N6)-dimethyltransferase